MILEHRFPLLAWTKTIALSTAAERERERDKLGKHGGHSCAYLSHALIISKLLNWKNHIYGLRPLCQRKHSFRVVSPAYDDNDADFPRETFGLLA